MAGDPAKKNGEGVCPLRNIFNDMKTDKKEKTAPEFSTLDI